MTVDSTADADGIAGLVVVRYSPVTDTVRSELTTSRYESYLRTAEAGSVDPGDEWDHFVSRGCGSTQDVVLTVEAVHGGDRIGERTDFEFRPADSDGTS